MQHALTALLLVYHLPYIVLSMVLFGTAVGRKLDRIGLQLPEDVAVRLARNLGARWAYHYSRRHIARPVARLLRLPQPSMHWRGPVLKIARMRVSPW